MENLAEKFRDILIDYELAYREAPVTIDINPHTKDSLFNYLAANKESFKNLGSYGNYENCYLGSFTHINHDEWECPIYFLYIPWKDMSGYANHFEFDQIYIFANTYRSGDILTLRSTSDSAIVGLDNNTELCLYGVRQLFNIMFKNLLGE